MTSFDFFDQTYLFNFIVCTFSAVVGLPWLHVMVVFPKPFSGGFVINFSSPFIRV
ncbi:hypothetical protein LM900277_130249 [Listeria monocytogenes]|nr:hypothetical protein LM900277_130249 [Listeria monocytogenes]